MAENFAFMGNLKTKQKTMTATRPGLIKSHGHSYPSQGSNQELVSRELKPTAARQLNQRGRL